MVEYRLVPLMVSVVKIGDELSAAALTRGLGAPSDAQMYVRSVFIFKMWLQSCSVSSVLFYFYCSSKLLFEEVSL